MLYQSNVEISSKTDEKTVKDFFFLRTQMKTKNKKVFSKNDFFTKTLAEREIREISVTWGSFLSTK